MKVLVIQHVACEGLGGLEGAFHREGMLLDVVNLWRGQELPKTIHNYGGLVILGGPMNVYEESQYPFLRDEGDLISEAISKGTPALGICLGAQLIAKACGARVTSGARKEIGWHDLFLTPDGEGDRIFSHFPRKFKVFQWHGDTFEIPRGATHLAASDLFPHQAFRYYNAYALQFHLEVDEGMIQAWLQENAAELASLPYIQPDHVLADTQANIAGLHQIAEGFYEQFLNLLGDVPSSSHKNMRIRTK